MTELKARIQEILDSYHVTQATRTSRFPPNHYYVSDKRIGGKVPSFTPVRERKFALLAMREMIAHEIALLVQQVAL